MKTTVPELKTFLAAFVLLGGAFAASGQVNPPAPKLIPVFECVEAPPPLDGTPLIGLTQPVPWAVFSYLSTFPSAKSVQPGIPQNNFLSPGPLTYSVQPNVFYPGYHKHAMSVQLGNSSPGPEDLTVVGLGWWLGGYAAKVPALNDNPYTSSTPSLGAAPSAYCSATIFPAIPSVQYGGTFQHQLLGTLTNPPPGQLPVSLSYAYSGSDSVSAYENNSKPDDSNGTTITNLQYENGEIYGDITVPSGSGTFVAWPEVIASVKGRVIAFGHMPILEGGRCSAAIQPSTLPDGQLGGEYTASISAVGSSTSFTFSATGTLPPGLTLTGGTLSGTPTTAGVYSFSIVGVPSDNSCIAAANYNVTISGPSCATDATFQVATSLTGLHKNLSNGQWTETVTLQNTGSSAIAGPINLVVEGLSANATLVNAQGQTGCFAPSGAPYVSVGSSLMPGQTASVTLTFTNSQPSQSITFTPRVAAGGNQL